jgi:hypothetical protein
MILRSPLDAAWSAQPVRLWLKGIEPGACIDLSLDGRPAEFQYTGQHSPERGAEVFVLLGFEPGQKRELQWREGNHCSTRFDQTVLSLERGVRLSPFGVSLDIPAIGSNIEAATCPGPICGFAGQLMQGEIHCKQPLDRATLTRLNSGPLFEEYELRYQFAQNRGYVISLRFWSHEPMVEVSERFSLGMDAVLKWTLNPQKHFTHILSRDSFEGESQPTLEPLGAEHPRDVLCRLQMPVLTEYFIPNNRGWLALLDERDHPRGMLGIMGLYGARWEEPVANMPELLDRKGTVEWHASLASGSRHWLLYHGPVETSYTPQRRFVFHRLHGEFNACRLDEHLDLTGQSTFDEPAGEGFFGQGDYHARAKDRVAAFASLQTVLNQPDAWMQQNGGMHLACYRYLIDPSPLHARALYDHLIARFEKWVRQFQGHRTGENDYMKNVIGFSRYLRGMLLGYEMLRRDGVLTAEQVGKLNAYFVFAARRITDEGRWPHSRTTLHPDHPESSRDFYTYGGEHKPDRLYWTNSLPNFQGDPLCALAHLSAVLHHHPDAPAWRRLALADIDGQLDAYSGKSGAWQESINYALYTLSYFVITFRALKAHVGIDYFHDERVRRLASWLVRFLGPKDKRWDKYTWPGVGNAICPSSGGEFLLCFAGQLDENDPLRHDLLSVWQKLESNCIPSEHYPTVMAALAPTIDRDHALRPLTSECMDEVGVAMRDRHTLSHESYLFQKIGFAKDHYEADESSFNWYAKGTPLCMDYGTYTGDVGVGGAHNIVEIPDEDNLRRGYLKAHHFTPLLDYTHCECPVTLKLLWGRVRSFEEVENKDGKIDRTKTPYFYIGDKNPIGPKVWKLRKLLFVKPDYVVLFDRVYGQVPHRYNLHVTGDPIQREGHLLRSRGRFDLDLLACVQHPQQFEMQTGELIPNLHPGCGGAEMRQRHAQQYCRLYNKHDGIYRTLLFAQERSRDVTITPLSGSGFRVQTQQYTDYVFTHNETTTTRLDEEGVTFTGSVGWIRKQHDDGQVMASVLEGDAITAFGVSIKGRGPWSYNLDGDSKITPLGGPPRSVDVRIRQREK